MGDNQKIRQKAEIALAKAEKLMDNQKPKQSAEEFEKAGELYFEIGEWKISEQCFFYASKNLYHIESYQKSANLQRLSANCCLLVKDYKKARDYYDLSQKSQLKSDAKNREDFSIVSACFAFLCHFIQGQQDEALGYIKRFKETVSETAFNEHVLVNLVKNLSNAIINENKKYLHLIFEDYPKFKFRTAEANLINICVIMAFTAVNMQYSLNLKDNEFVMDKIIELKSSIMVKELKSIQNHPLIPYTYKSIAITDIGTSLGDNLSLKEKPSLPIQVDLNTFTDIALPIKLRTNFPGRGFIGPFLITVEVDKDYHLFLKSEVKEISISSPHAVLELKAEPLKTAIINQVFPMNIIIKNNSLGEAVDINIELEFPEEFKMMRGTFTKNIYALRPNEELKWEIQVKSMEVGEVPIKGKITFKSPDGKEQGSINEELKITING